MAMTEIVMLTGQSRRELAEYLNHADNRQLPVRICIDEGTVKVRVDRGVWSAPMGEMDPACEAARPVCPCGNTSVH